VPYALKNLRWLLHKRGVAHRLAALMEAFKSMVASEKVATPHSSVRTGAVDRAGFQFFLHRGLPQDDTGNGGGFVFDGRSLPIPDAKSVSKTLTGKDVSVIDYLNRQESVHQFLASAISLVDASVTTYQRRGFKHLMVSSAAPEASIAPSIWRRNWRNILRAHNGVEVVVVHREQEQLNQ